MEQKVWVETVMESVERGPMLEQHSEGYTYMITSYETPLGTANYEKAKINTSQGRQNRRTKT